MNKPLPTLTLLKTKDLLLLNVPLSNSAFSACLAQFDVKSFNEAHSKIQLERLCMLGATDSVPYSIVADFNLLSKNDFLYIKALRRNAATRNLPIIAIIKEYEEVNHAYALKNGIDDCYRTPIDARDLCERIDFLKKYKKQMASAQTETTEELVVKISPFKRAVDITIAGTAIALLSPVFLMTALCVRLESRGPIIYRSKRSGVGYKEFDFFKFRSMYADADERLRELQHLNQYTEGDSAFVKFKDDPRITKVGRFIRKYSIDELPQLFNVLKGDMSIVGNRPLPLYEAEQLTKEDATYRFLAPAGITGLWQVTKRGHDNMSAQERINLDVTYAKNNSFWYDLKILLKTPFAIIQKENV